LTFLAFLGQFWGLAWAAFGALLGLFSEPFLLFGIFSHWQFVSCVHGLPVSFFGHFRGLFTVFGCFALLSFLGFWSLLFLVFTI